MNSDSQARQLLDRIEIDFVQMIKLSDVDYYLKSNPSPSPTQYRYAQQQGNDIIAFYGAVPGYLPTSNHKSPISLVAYRVNSDSSPSSYNKYNKMERMGKGLLWNGAPSPSPTPPGTPPPTPTPTPV